MTTESFRFAADAGLRRWSRLFAVRPERCTVLLSAHELTVTFGRWSLTTEPANISSVEVTGPYRWWKVAGPPRLSLADRGITFATTADRGVCIELRRPVGAIDPLHLVKHPNVTLTLAEPDRFAAELTRVVRDADVAPPPTDPADRPHGTVLATISALLRWRRRGGSVIVHERDVATIDPPPQPRHVPAEAQHLGDGVGAGFHQRYRVVVPEAPMSATEAMAGVQADPNMLTRVDFAPFNRVAGVAGDMRVGDRFVIELAGPWDGPVEVVDVTPTSFRLATLDGHMEAGLIEFSVENAAGGALQLTIESWARSGDAGMNALYDRVGTAKHLQSEMWVEACEAFAAAVGDGRPHDPVEIVSERAAATGHPSPPAGE